MTIPTCLAKLIPALWLSSAGLLACAGLWAAAPAPVSRPSASSLAGLTRAYREAPTPARRAALESYAVAHAKGNTGALARLAMGIAAYEQKDYSAAIAALEAIQFKLPRIADYTAYYLTAARLQLNDASIAASAA